MKMTNLSKALMAAGLMTAAAAAHAGVTGNVAFTSDYLFRGVSQTSNNAAIQGTLSYAHDSGLYATAWGSSVSGANPVGGLELDTLLGFSGKSGDLGYDVGVMRYNYPGATDPLAYNEVYGSVSMMGGKLGLNYSNDYYGGTDKFLYTYLEYSATVSEIGLFAHVGMNSFDSAAMMTASLGLAGTNTDDSYMDYKLAVSKTLGGVGLELAYMGSNIDDTECGGGICEGRVVGTVSKAF